MHPVEIPTIKYMDTVLTSRIVGEEVGVYDIDGTEVGRKETDGCAVGGCVDGAVVG